MESVRKLFRNKIVLAAFAGLIVAIVVIALLLRKSEKQTLSFRQFTVARGSITANILSTGVVQSENRLEIKPPLAGRAEQILVDEGYDVKEGQVLFWMSSTERAAMLDAARARGSDELKKWEEFYKPTPVLAPIDGTIILRNIQPGQTFTSADAVLVMSDRLTVQAQVDETDISDIHLKQPANVVLDAYPRDNIPAHVLKIAYDAKTVNNVTTYIVDVLPDKTPEFMRSGMTANVNFLVGTKDDVLLIPSEGVRSSDGSAYVLMASTGADGKPEERAIESGLSDGKHVEVVSGLSEGDTILVPQLKGSDHNKAAASTSPLSPFGGRPPR